MKRYVIIVAGGTGTRMKSSLPKQFMLLNGKPSLMITMQAFKSFDANLNIVLAVPENHIEHWQLLCKDYNFLINHEIVKGGYTRFHSVKNALVKVDDESLVAVHDGVRPLVNCKTIANVFNTAEELGNAVPCIKLSDSIRMVEPGGVNLPANRDLYRLIQTPQAFHSKLLKKAYKQDFQESFTDDASVVEQLGIKINLVSGNAENIKITRPSDLKFANGFLSK